MHGHESELIQALFAPLALGHAGAFGLRDDAAFFRTAADGLIITQDQVIEGTHFLATDPLDMVAKRLVRRNLSDLIAKGCKPKAAFLSLAWPAARPWSDLAGFAQGLGADLDQLCGQCPLLGGDTSTIKGPMVASMTMIGEAAGPRAGPVLRSGGRVGDVIVTTGVIGDAYLGLQVRLGHEPEIGLENCVAISMAPYPPPVMMAESIAQFAKASLDVSDGLLGDASHMAHACGLHIALDLATMPYSSQARSWLDRQADFEQAQLKLLTGGDDYQPLIALDPQDVQAFVAMSGDMGVAVTPIGRCEAGRGISLSQHGIKIALPVQLGWSV